MIEVGPSHDTFGHEAHKGIIASSFTQILGRTPPIKESSKEMGRPMGQRSLGNRELDLETWYAAEGTESFFKGVKVWTTDPSGIRIVNLR